MFAESLTELRRRLSARVEGNYTFETSRTCTPVGSQWADELRAYVLRANGECWKHGLAAENPTLAQANEAMIAEHGGTALGGSVAPPPDSHVRGRLTARGEQVAVDQEYAGVQGKVVRESYRWSAEERIGWRSIDVARKPTSRLGPPEPHQPFPPDALCSVHDFQQRGLVLLELAANVDSSIRESSSGGIEGVVSLDRWTSRNAFRHPLHPGHGVLELPGEVRFTLEAVREQSSSLMVRWHDCLGALLVEERMTWSPRDDFPRELARRYFAPGLDVSVQVESSWFSPAGDDEPGVPLEWTPEPSEVVIDERFGKTVRYAASATGVLPTDEVIQAQAMSGPEVPVDSNIQMRAPDPAPAATPAPPEPVFDRAYLWSAAVLVALVGLWAFTRK